MIDGDLNMGDDLTTPEGTESSSNDANGESPESLLSLAQELTSAIGSHEWRGNDSPETYRHENRIGAMGRYQFMPKTLSRDSKKYFGYEVTKSQFLSNPALQDQLAVARTYDHLVQNLQETGNLNEAINYTIIDHYGWNGGARDLNSPQLRQGAKRGGESPLSYLSAVKNNLSATPEIAISTGNITAPRIPTSAPVLTGGKPFTLEDVFNPPPDTTEQQQQQPSGEQPADQSQPSQETPSQTPFAQAASPDVMERFRALAKRQREIDAEKATAPASAPAPSKQKSFDPQDAAYDFAKKTGQDNPIVGNPFELAPKPGYESVQPIAESTKQKPSLTPEMAASLGGVRDKVAQEQSAQLQVPIRGYAGVYRPYVAPDGTKGSVLASEDTNDKIEEARRERVKQTQDVVLGTLASSLGASPMGLVSWLAANSEVVKDVGGTSVTAANMTLGGLPQALAPKAYGALKELTTNPNPVIAGIQEAAGTAAGIGGSIVGGSFKAAGVASESLLGRLAVQSPLARMGATFAIESLPREIAKVATGQQTATEAAGNVAESAVSGAVLGGGGMLGSKLAEAAGVGRFGTAAIKAATGGATMGATDVLTGNAPTLQSVLLGATMEGMSGAKEGAPRGDVNFYKRDLIKTLDKDNLIDHTVAAVGNVLDESAATGFSVGRADVKNAIYKAVDEGHVTPADALARATEILHSEHGGDMPKDDFVDAVGQQIERRVVAPGPQIAADQTPQAQPKADVLAETPHVAAGGQYETEAPIVERQIRSGKKRGQTQRGVIATDLNEEQVQSITNRAPIKEGDGFFIPERYVKRPEAPQEPSAANAPEGQVAAAPEAVAAESEPLQPISGGETAAPAEVERVEAPQDQSAIARTTENETVNAVSPAEASISQDSIDRVNAMRSALEKNKTPVHLGGETEAERGADVDRVNNALIVTDGKVLVHEPLPDDIRNAGNEDLGFVHVSGEIGGRDRALGINWELIKPKSNVPVGEPIDIGDLLDRAKSAKKQKVRQEESGLSFDPDRIRRTVNSLSDLGAERVTLERQGESNRLVIRDVDNPDRYAIVAEGKKNVGDAQAVASEQETPVSEANLERPAVATTQEGEPSNAIETRNEPENREPEHRGAASGENVRTDEGEVRGGQSEQAIDRNRPVEETGVREEAPVAQGVSEQERGRIIAETNAKISPSAPNAPSNKEVRAYAESVGIETKDAQGNFRDRPELLSAIHEDAISKATRPITDDVGVARGTQTRPLSPMESSGVLKATIPGAEAAVRTTKELGAEVKQYFTNAVEHLRGIVSGAKRATYPQARQTILDPNLIKDTDLHRTPFEYNGGKYRVSVTRNLEGERITNFYDISGERPKLVINPSDALREKMTDAAKQAYIANAKASAMRTALLLRDVGGVQARQIGIRTKEVEQLRSVFQDRSDAENHRFISDIMAGRELTDPVEKEAADVIRKVFREQGQRIMDAAKAIGKDIHFDLRDNFFSLLWKDTSRANLGVIMGAKTPFGGTKYFLQKKVFQDIAEGIEKGLTPAYSNPFDFAMHYVAESEKMIAGFNAAKRLKDMGYGRMIANKKNVPAGWERVEGMEKFSRDKNTGALQKFGEYYAPSGAAQVLNNYFSRGIEGHFLGKAYKGWMLLNNHLNQLQLSLSGFHATFVTMESIMSRVSLGINEAAYGALHGDKRFLLQGAKKIGTALGAPFGTELGKAVQTEWFKPGTTGNNMAASIADALMHGGMRGEMPREHQAGKPKIVTGQGFVRSGIETGKNILKESAKDWNDGRKIASLVGLGTSIVEAPTRAILENYVPHMKFMAATEMAKFELEKFSARNGRDATQEELSAMTSKIVDVIDDRFGELAYDNLFWNKAFKQTAMAVQRSVGWNYGVLRTVLGGAYDYAKNAVLLGGKGLEAISGGRYTQETSPQFTQRMSYLFAFPTVAATLGSIINVLATGTLPGSEDGSLEGTLKDMFFPRTGGTDANGNPSRISIPSYANDAFNLIQDALSMRPGPQVGHPLRTVSHKVSPMFTMFNDMVLTGKDYYDRQIFSEGVPWYEKAAEGIGYVARQGLPMSAVQITQSFGENKGVFPYLAMVGVKPAPPTINRTAMQEFLSEKSAEARAAGGKSNAKYNEYVATRQIESMYRQGKTTEANALAQEKMREGTIAPNDVVKAYSDAHFSVRESQFKNATAENAMTAYFDVASDNERKQLAKQMQQHLFASDIYSLNPSAARERLGRIENAEQEGKTKYLDPHALRSYKEGLRGYLGLYQKGNLPKMQFKPIPAR